MKILFIVPYPSEGPSNRFRVEQYLPELSRRGIEYSLRPFCGTVFYRILLKKGRLLKKIIYAAISTISRMTDLVRAPKYDIVFIHREAFPHDDFVFELLFRLLAKRLIYDFDDAIFLKKPGKVKYITRVSDRVITGNAFLAEYAGRMNRNVVTIPTCIDTEKYRPSVPHGGENKIVIGWIGTPTTSVYIKSIADALRSISEKFPSVEIRIIGGSLKNSDGVPGVLKDWTLDDELRELQGFDIGIMPMPDDDWTKGKCAFKLIQYMSVGIPSVASPVGMNRSVIEDGVSGFFASTSSEWVEKLSTLIGSAELRKSMGDNARRAVEERFSLKKNSTLFIDTLERISSDKPKR